MCGDVTEAMLELINAFNDIKQEHHSHHRIARNQKSQRL
jgi:hypothetical protein